MLHATFFNAQGNDVTQVLLRHKNVGTHDWLAHVFNHGKIRQLGRVVDVNRFTGLEQQLKNYGWRSGDQVQVVLALQALLNDLHVQHAEEAATEAEAQCVRAFWRVLQRRIVQRQLLQRVTEVFKVIGADREQARIHLRLNTLETGQYINIRRRAQGQGIAHWRTVNVLDTGDDETYFTGFQVGSGGVFRVEYTDAVHQVDLAGGLDQNLVALFHAAVAHANQGHNAQVVVEPGVDDQRLQRIFDIAGRRRNGVYQALKHLVHAQAGLGAAGHGISGVDANDFFDLFFNTIRIGLWQVDLVQNRHHFQALLDRGVAVGYGLGFYALPRIDHQQGTFTGRQGATDFVGEVNVARGVNEVQLVGFAVFGRVIQGDAVGLDGDPALTLEVHGVQYLGFHFAGSQATAHLDKTIGQRRLAMVNVGDDGEIADMTQITHGSTLKKVAGRLPAEK